MQANPDKFQVLPVGKKTFDKNMKICIQNSTLSCEEIVKLLGIEIDYQLNFDIHISNWCSHRIQSEVLFPALSLIFLNFYRYKHAKPKGRS
jgi:hypothetical protein